MKGGDWFFQRADVFGRESRVIVDIIVRQTPLQAVGKTARMHEALHRMKRVENLAYTLGRV